ncbi:Ubiquitin-conjugating enzyme E2 G1 [Merluccius polli]|uniref:Ubiquitin-conjugating enzyme E2 G1 n=1 Tax=Merluccius polli TaxID=89951 RepID=A0AA47M1T9_MERPO|nr:Ubiquitin-conjugating enzyme E2 G1 [Merluccius polli]
MAEGSTRIHENLRDEKAQELRGRSVMAKNGDVCISILHEPGEDKYGYEKPEERWLPIHTVETIMISVISMLADPNGDSPANVDAAVSIITKASNIYQSATRSNMKHVS